MNNLKKYKKAGELLVMEWKNPGKMRHHWAPYPSWHCLATVDILRSGIRICGGHCVSSSDVHRKVAWICLKDGGMPPEVGVYGDSDTFPQYIRYSAGTSSAKTFTISKFCMSQGNRRKNRNSVKRPLGGLGPAAVARFQQLGLLG